jgi:hypothetical protein
MLLRCSLKTTIVLLFTILYVYCINKLFVAEYSSLVGSCIHNEIWDGRECVIVVYKRGCVGLLVDDDNLEDNRLWGMPKKKCEPHWIL